MSDAAVDANTDVAEADAFVPRERTVCQNATPDSDVMLITASGTERLPFAWITQLDACGSSSIDLGTNVEGDTLGPPFVSFSTGLSDGLDGTEEIGARLVLADGRPVMLSGTLTITEAAVPGDDPRRDVSDADGWCVCRGESCEGAPDRVRGTVALRASDDATIEVRGEFSARFCHIDHAVCF